MKLTQLSGETNTFWTLRERNRLFVLAGGGTSFGDHPLPTDQFTLGSPMHLGAYSIGELRGDHYYILTAGLMRQVGRMPDFMGGPVFAAYGLENGDTFDTGSSATLRTNLSGSIIVDTLVGPVIVAASALQRPMADLPGRRPDLRAQTSRAKRLFALWLARSEGNEIDVPGGGVHARR